MGCFTAPLAEAIVVSVAKKIIEKRTAKAGEVTVKESKKEVDLTTFTGKLGLLNKMLYGGSALLAFEHLWHGEVVPFFPFLTAAANHEDAMEMLYEIATTGVTMAVLVTAIWGVMCVVLKKIQNRNTISAKA